MQTASFQYLPLPLEAILDHLLGRQQITRCYAAQPKARPGKDSSDKFYPLPQVVTSGFYCPAIARVIFNEDTTIVTFKDGTKSVVVKEPNDKQDRITAVVYAIVKRTLATSYNAKTNAVNAAYINAINNAIANAYDQQAEAAKNAEQERVAKRNHEARQAKESAEAFERKARARAEELRLEARAKQILEEDSLKKTKKVLTENAPAEQFFNENEAAWKSYVRPDKPFSKFTDEEKKAYWRAHNAKRRAAK